MAENTASENDGKQEDTSDRDTHSEEPTLPQDEKPNIWMGCGLPGVVSALLLIGLAFSVALRL